MANIKIKWALRLKNKATLASLIALVIGFVYSVLGLFEIVPKISENDITTFATFIIEILVGIGIVVDPTTSGIGDSAQAMSYTEPKKDK